MIEKIFHLLGLFFIAVGLITLFIDILLKIPWTSLMKLLWSISSFQAGAFEIGLGSVILGLVYMIWLKNGKNC